MEGGYLMISLSQSDLFNKLLIGKDLGKPILIRDGKQNYFIDSLTGGEVTAYEDDGITPLTYSDIVLTHSNNVVTIKQNGTITKSKVVDDEYVDALQNCLSYDSDNGELVVGADVNFDNYTIYNAKLNTCVLDDNLDANDNIIKNVLLEDGKLENDFDCNNNELGDVNTIVFHDETSMSTAPKLYEYLVQCSFDNENEDNQIILFRLLSNEDKDLSNNNLNNLKLLIGNKQIPVSSTCNDIIYVTSGDYTLVYKIWIHNNNIILSNINDSSETSYTNFNIDNYSKTQII